MADEPAEVPRRTAPIEQVQFRHLGAGRGAVVNQRRNRGPADAHVVAGDLEVLSRELVQIRLEHEQLVAERAVRPGQLGVSLQRLKADDLEREQAVLLLPRGVARREYPVVSRPSSATYRGDGEMSRFWLGSSPSRLEWCGF